MPTTIDEEKFVSQETLDLSKPQGTAQGLPVKQIAHQEYPRCVYKHPVEPYREVLHRNTQHEVVERELVATEHLVHVCQDEQEHKKKLSEGWVEEPYIQQAPPDPTEHLYSKVTEEVEKRLGKKQSRDEGKGE
jgi:predicted DNA-binding transcriptional regulator